jgi:hypothetical protein
LELRKHVPHPTSPRLVVSAVSPRDVIYQTDLHPQNSNNTSAPRVRRVKILFRDISQSPNMAPPTPAQPTKTEALEPAAPEIFPPEDRIQHRKGLRQQSFHIRLLRRRHPILRKSPRSLPKLPRIRHRHPALQHRRMPPQARRMERSRRVRDKSARRPRQTRSAAISSERQ